MLRLGHVGRTQSLREVANRQSDIRFDSLRSLRLNAACSPVPRFHLRLKHPRLPGYLLAY